jgi:DNA-binding FrmR family transcriptional regulator
VSGSLRADRTLSAALQAMPASASCPGRAPRATIARFEDPGAPIAPNGEDCDVAILTDEKSRTDLLNRLKRAEGQLRGIQRMLEEGQPCLDIASQMAAVRKALDSTYVRMTVCFMEQELGARMGADPAAREHLGAMLEDMQTLLAKVR